MVQEFIFTKKEDLEALIQNALDRAVSKTLATTSQEKSEKDKLYTRKETAKLLGISLTTLDSYAKDNILPRRMVGGTIRYAQSDIDKALQGNYNSLKYSRRTLNSRV